MTKTLYGLSKDQRIAARRIPKDARCILEHTNGSACYAYECAGKFLMMAFWGTSARSLYHYSYRTAEQRDLAIWNFKHDVEGSVARRTKEATERKSQPCTLKVGDIVNTSWGYDQTNVEFYVVTRVSKARVWVRQIASDYEATGYMQGRCWPAMPIQMIGEETMHVARGDHFSIDGHGAHLTKGDTYSSSYA